MLSGAAAGLACAAPAVLHAQTLLSSRSRLSKGGAVFNVNPSGSDSAGDGSSKNPWKTPQGAWQYLKANVDFAEQSATVVLAPGTYPGFTGAGRLVGQGMAATLTFAGGPGVVVNGVFVADDGGMFALQDITFRGGIYAQEDSLIVLTAGPSNGCNFTTTNQIHINAQIGGRVVFAGNYAISGNAPVHWAFGWGGKIFALNPMTLTLRNNPKLGKFAFGTIHGELGLKGVTISGNANVSDPNYYPYYLTQSSFITTGGHPGLIPGSGGYADATSGIV